MGRTVQLDTDPLVRRARFLAWATVAWNAVEAVIAVSAGTAAGSIGLVSFGIDSVIEVGSALVVLWQFNDGPGEDRQRTALRAIAVSFFGLAIYAGGRAVVDLVSWDRADESVVGIVLAAVSLLVMPTLALAKRRTGRQMGSRTVQADSAQTMLSTYLSAALLIGLGANAWLGWWWADPAIGLVVAGLAVVEGREARNGEDDCC